MSPLEISATAGESSSVVVLVGEADLTSAARLNLRFADSAAIRARMVAALILRDQGGSPVLWHPQQLVISALSLLGIDRMFTVGGQQQNGTGPDGGPEQQSLPGGELASLVDSGRAVRPSDRVVRQRGCQHRRDADRGD
ncbi:MAG TPA: hypothetical protein VGI66_08335 [Streptosporangiaceae bacterium]